MGQRTVGRRRPPYAPPTGALAFRSFLSIVGEAEVLVVRPARTTLALVAGVSPKTVREQLGHASVAFTLEVYSHVLSHMQDEPAMKVEALLLGDVIVRCASVRHGGSMLWRYPPGKESGA
jgi:integrase